MGAGMSAGEEIYYYSARDVVERLQDHKCPHGRYCPILFYRYPRVNYYSCPERKKIDRLHSIGYSEPSSYPLHHHVWLLDFSAGKLAPRYYTWGMPRECWEHFGYNYDESKKSPEDTSIGDANMPGIKIENPSPSDDHIKPEKPEGTIIPKKKLMRASDVAIAEN